MTFTTMYTDLFSQAIIADAK